MIDIEKVSVLDLKPSQTIVVQIRQKVPRHEIESVRKLLQNVFPNNVVLVLDNNTSLSIIDEENKCQQFTSKTVITLTGQAESPASRASQGNGLAPLNDPNIFQEAPMSEQS